MNTEQLESAQDLIDNLERNSLVSLTELYGDDWVEISEPKVFGKKFKRAVENGSLKSLSHKGIRSTGRCDEYLKI